LKKKIIFALIFLIVLVFSYPTLYFYYIKHRVYKATSKVFLSIIEYRRYALTNNIPIGFYFDFKDNSYTIFKDINNNASYDTRDEIIKTIFIQDTDKNILLYDFFYNLDIHLKNNTIILYPDASCSVANNQEDASVFFIHKTDLENNNFNRIFRIKFSKLTCEIKISKVLNVDDKIIEFEN